MKEFRKQYCECAQQGMNQPGELQKFKDHPELLPAPWHPAAPRAKALLEKDPEAGLTPMNCLRFGGQCHSANRGCRHLRGYKDWT